MGWHRKLDSSSPRGPSRRGCRAEAGEAAGRSLSPAFQIKFLAILFGSFIFSFSSAFAGSLPAAADITNLSAETEKCVDNFYAQTFDSRFAIQFAPFFLTEDDKQQLSLKISAAVDTLADIEQSQREILIRIENYDGDDWNTRYGSTGLWRKLKVDIYSTNLSVCEIEIFKAFLSQGPQRSEILRGLLESLNQLESDFESARLDFDRARVYSLLSDEDLLYRAIAKSRFEKLLERSDIGECGKLKVRIERAKLNGQADLNVLRTLSEQLSQGICGSEIGPVLSLGFLFRKAGELESFERTIKSNTQAQSFLGDFFIKYLLKIINQGQNISQAVEYINVFEAELAAKSALRTDTGKYKGVFELFISNERFRRPVVLYAAARSLADSLPERAIELLVETAEIQKTSSDEDFAMKPEQIARQAVNLAYEKYVQEQIDCNCVLTAFDDYQSIAGDIIDGQLSYGYIYVLRNCGQLKRADSLLKNLADMEDGYWPKRARLDLLEQQIEQIKSEQGAVPPELTNKLEFFIQSFDSNGIDFRQLEYRAVKIYCTLMLDSNQSTSSQKILDVLTDDRLTSDPNLYAFKAVALSLLDKPSASADCFLKAFESNKCLYVPQAMQFLSKFVEKIDVYQDDVPDFAQTAENCRNLSSLCCDCLEDSQKQNASLLLAEISTFTEKGDSEKLTEIENLLDDIEAEMTIYPPDLIRCRARLLTARGDFEKGAQLWSQLVSINGTINSQQSHTLKWWRAKYYELFCIAALSQQGKESVVHTIEVLENTYQDIPAFWANKLVQLKRNTAGSAGSG